MTLLDLLLRAGWPMVPLYVLSLIAAVVGVYELVRILGDQVDGTHRLARETEGMTLKDLPSAAARWERQGPVGRVLTEAALAHLGNGRERAYVERTAMSELDAVERHLPLLGFIAQAAPLLGLLGTVVGLVELFVGMEGASMNAGTLSGGIWKALLTTAAGLCIAVPTLGVHAAVVVRSRRLRRSMEHGAATLFELELRR